MSSKKKFKSGDPTQETVELQDALYNIINGDDSDVDFDVGDEDVVDDPPYLPNADDSSEGSADEDGDLQDIAEAPSTSFSQIPAATSSQRRVYWKTTNQFDPLPPAPPYEVPERLIINLPPYDYFTKYIPSDIYEQIAFKSNQYHLSQTGISLNTTEKEIKTFFGITIIMSYLRYPRIRMYWEQKTRVAAVADRMARDRYFKLRSSLKIVNDMDVPDAEKQKTKFWKLQPLIACVRNGCLINTPTPDVCVDEQMIPFWGKHEARQMIKGKPNPVGLKNFVLARPNGLPLDFSLYEGKGDSILDDEKVQQLDIGGKVVVRLCKRLPPGCSVYMDRYFTSVDLFDILHIETESSGTGTLQKNRIPSNCNFKTDAELRRLGRGSYCQQVLSTGQIAAVKWFDNKPVHLASSIHGALPTDECRRWDKKQKRYLNVQRPAIFAKYNENMGGVDFLDRMISYYRISARTRKWTVRLIFHLFDFAIAAAWIEYVEDQDKLGTRKRNILDCLGFREALADYLLEYEIENEEDCPTDDDVTIARQSKKARTAHPTDFVRKKRVDHLPIVLDSNKNRCRLPGCKSNRARHQCPTCKVTLCLMSDRNCYKVYHEQ